MKGTYYLLITVLLSLLLGCNYTEPKTTITNSIDIDGIDHILVFGTDTGLLDSISTGGKANIKIRHPQVLNIKTKKQSGAIYITPGSQITISSKKGGFYYNGDYSEENNMLASLTYAMSWQGDIMNLWDLAHVKEVDFLRSMTAKRGRLDSIVNTVQNIDAQLKKWIDKRINAFIAYDKMQYPHYHQVLTQDTVELSKGYENYLADIDVNDSDLLHFYEGQHIIKSILQKEVDFEEVGAQYQRILFDKANRLVSNQKNKEYLLKEYLIDNISNGSGIDYVGDMLAVFTKVNTNEAYQREVDVLIEAWDDLRKGEAAPSFQGITSNDEVVALEDLKGKSIYVDLWATWCQPCIREIPYLKKLEHEYQDENIEFVSISVDKEKDKEKWKKFLESKELGGIQLFADQDRKDELYTNYKIAGIPRFILIDAKGKIVSANAPRPSNPELNNMLTSLLGE